MQRLWTARCWAQAAVIRRFCSGSWMAWTRMVVMSSSLASFRVMFAFMAIVSRLLRSGLDSCGLGECGRCSCVSVVGVRRLGGHFRPVFVGSRGVIRVEAHTAKRRRRPPTNRQRAPAKQVDAKAEARGETAEHGDHATPERLRAELAGLIHEPRRQRRPHDQRASAAAPSSALVRARPGRETPRGGEPPSTTAVDTASARPPR